MSPKWRRALGYGWQVLIGVISALVTAVLLDAFAGNKFQGAVIAGLGLIYVTIRSVGVGVVMMLRNVMRGLDTDLTRVRLLLGDEVGDREARARVLDTMHVELVKAIINGVFMAINSFLCGAVLWNALHK